MEIWNSIYSLVSSWWVDITILCTCIIAVTMCYRRHLKGIKSSKHYIVLFAMLSLARLVQITQKALPHYFTSNIISTILVAFFLIVGIYHGYIAIKLDNQK